MKIDSKLEHCRQFKPVFENHTKEFVKLWKSGQEATLNINCKNGRAWINLSTYLGYYKSNFKDDTFIPEDIPKRSKSKSSTSKLCRNKMRAAAYTEKKMQEMTAIVNNLESRSGNSGLFDAVDSSA